MVEIDSLEGAMSATPMREAYYRGEIWEDAFPQGTIAFTKPSKTASFINNYNTNTFKIKKPILSKLLIHHLVWGN